MGKAFLMPIIDHVSKYAVGENADTDLALKGWKKAKNMLRRLNVSIEGIIIHHDRETVS